MDNVLFVCTLYATTHYMILEFTLACTNSILDTHIRFIYSIFSDTSDTFNALTFVGWASERASGL